VIRVDVQRKRRLEIYEVELPVSGQYRFDASPSDRPLSAADMDYRVLPLNPRVQTRPLSLSLTSQSIRFFIYDLHPDAPHSSLFPRPLLLLPITSNLSFAK
jgi:hypothetical protein